MEKKEALLRFVVPVISKNRGLMENYTDKFLFGLIEFFAWAKWLFFLALVLTLGDLKFGIAASRYRKDPIKRSRAVRRTMDKITSYIIWVVMAFRSARLSGNHLGSTCYRL